MRLRPWPESRLRAPVRGHDIGFPEWATPGAGFAQARSVPRVVDGSIDSTRVDDAVRRSIPARSGVGCDQGATREVFVE